MLENNSNYDNIKQYLADKLREMRDKVAQGQIEYDDIKHIEECITVLAENNGYDLTDNLHAIAKAKYRFFGNDWKKCTCVKDYNHSCISQACRDEIEKNGVCGCNLYKRK